MARMLQALKNLEARTIRQPANSPSPVAAAASPPGEEALASELPEAETPSIALMEAEPEVTEGLPNPFSQVPVADQELFQEVASNIDFASAELAKLSFTVNEEPLPVADWVQSELNVSAVSVVVEDALGASSPVAKVVPVAAEPALQRIAATAVKREAMTALERTAVRTLSDPIRARPLVDLAERILSDIKQTGGKTLLSVGVGEASACHETLLYAGILLADRRHGEILLVDADASRRAFSGALAEGESRGLGELVCKDISAAELCRPLATSNLSFLPAGRWVQSDLSTAGPRLERVLQELAERYSVVLIDGGRSNDLAASALARHADATYLVVQLGAVEAAAAQAALRDFRAGGARVLGCIAT